MHLKLFGGWIFFEIFVSANYNFRSVDFNLSLNSFSPFTCCHKVSKKEKYQKLYVKLYISSYGRNVQRLLLNVIQTFSRTFFAKAVS